MAALGIEGLFTRPRFGGFGSDYCRRGRRRGGLLCVDGAPATASGPPLAPPSCAPRRFARPKPHPSAGAGRRPRARGAASQRHQGRAPQAASSHTNEGLHAAPSPGPLLPHFPPNSGNTDEMWHDRAEFVAIAARRCAEALPGAPPSMRAGRTAARRSRARAGAPPFPRSITPPPPRGPLTPSSAPKRRRAPSRPRQARRSPPAGTWATHPWTSAPRSRRARARSPSRRASSRRISWRPREGPLGSSCCRASRTPTLCSRPSACRAERPGAPRGASAPGPVPVPPPAAPRARRGPLRRRPAAGAGLHSVRGAPARHRRGRAPDGVRGGGAAKILGSRKKS
jgi:hypothetical protein